MRKTDMTVQETGNTYGTAGQLKDSPLWRKARSTVIRDVIGLIEEDKYGVNPFPTATGFRNWAVDADSIIAKLEAMIKETV